jgi:predicted nucleotidyltransferase
MLDGFDPQAVGEIGNRLDLARQSGVRILFAIESGSRAWGFPSPDSDYDCRFVYVWPPDDHLVLRVQRDVIEFPIEGDIDAGGWDLRKALLLAMNGNAVIREWASSPFVYEEIEGFRASLLDVLDQITPPAMVARHYFGLLRRHGPTPEASDFKLKKLFYAIRPALSLLYMEQRDFVSLPPMELPALMAGVDLPAPLVELIASMVETKKVTREMGTGPVPSLIAAFLAETHARFEGLTEKLGSANLVQDTERFADAERFYRAIVLKHGL